MSLVQCEGIAGVMWMSDIIALLILAEMEGIYSSAICTMIVTCDGFQRYEENEDPVESDGSFVFCKSLKVITGNNCSAYRNRVNPL